MIPKLVTERPFSVRTLWPKLYRFGETVVIDECRTVLVWDPSHHEEWRRYEYAALSDFKVLHDKWDVLRGQEAIDFLAETDT